MTGYPAAGCDTLAPLLLGPLRMDYEKALLTVRSAATELSRFVEEVYADDR